jgi:hypothetical protein
MFNREIDSRSSCDSAEVFFPSEPAVKSNRNTLSAVLPAVVGALGLLTCGFAPAAEFRDNVEIVAKGSSSRTVRDKALAALPLEKLSSEDRQQADAVLRDLSVFRELPTCRFEVEPEVYHFFADNPDVAVSIWRAMKISKFEMTQTCPGTYAVDGRDGTQGAVRVVYRSPHECLMLCQGSFKSPVVGNPIHAKAILHMQTSFSTSAEGQSHATHRLCFFASFPSQTIETAARIISPVSNAIVDRNFRETSLFVYMMSFAMARQPGWVERIIEQLEGVPDASKEQLLDVTAKVYVADQKRIAKALGKDGVTLNELKAPLGAESIAPATAAAPSKPAVQTISATERSASAE